MKINFYKTTHRYLYILVFLVSNVFTYAQDVSPEEKAALLAFYNATGGPNWKNTIQGKGVWDFTKPVMQWNQVGGWHGVGVENGKITSLSLGGNNLNGNVPSQIGSLINLVVFQMGSNSLEGSLPIEFFNLKNLKMLELTNNKFNGAIPSEIGNLNELLHLSVYNAGFTYIPSSIGSLVKLQHLDLTGAEFVNGTIPVEFGNLVNLGVLAITNTKLTGSLKDELYKLRTLVKLQTLHMQANSLYGPVPSEIGIFKELIHLSFATNKLTGSLPLELGNLTNLKSFHVNFNQIEGEAFHIITKLTNLEDLGLSHNKFKETIKDFDKLTKLRSFQIQQNNFSGSFGEYLPTGLHTFSIIANNFRFIDFINLHDKLKTIRTYEYKYQAPTDTAITLSKTATESVTFTMCEDNRFLPEDTFQWYKDGQIIPGATSRIYTIPSLTVNDAGVYTCKSNNPNVANLTLTRNPITLQVAPPPCFDCTSFELIPSKKYLISGWVKEEISNAPEVQFTNYTQSYLGVSFTGSTGALIGNVQKIAPAGNIIDGWQRIVGEFIVPATVDDINIELINEGIDPNKMAYFDDIRVIPSEGNMKSFVYDQQTQRLMAELDENNYGTFYEYDLEGGLVRIKKETEKGVFTIQETRSGNQKK